MLREVRSWGSGRCARARGKVSDERTEIRREGDWGVSVSAGGLG